MKIDLSSTLSNEIKKNKIKKYKKNPIKRA